MSYNTIKKKELIRFLFGGGSAVLVDYMMYHLLMNIGLQMNLSKAISFILGSIVGFVINKLWTFESCKFSKGEIKRYCILYLCTACINTAINRMILWLFYIPSIGFIGATGVSTILNFLGQKYFVFKK